MRRLACSRSSPISCQVCACSRPSPQSLYISAWMKYWSMAVSSPASSEFDTEEDHAHWLEQQLHLITLVGEENYLQSQMGEGSSPS